MNHNYLLVPIHLDGLWAHTKSYAVRDQVMDYDYLPYHDPSKGDVNSDTPYLGESISKQPFENKNLILGEGIHLHWALPDALTVGKEVENSIQLPNLPDRWLICRKRGEIHEKQWILESNYLYPEGVNKKGAAVSIPFKNGAQPYSFMGRNMELSVWKSTATTGSNYYENLTAIGFGDPGFTAYYPNCHSVFGFYDDEITDVKNLTYEVYGWYAKEQEDPLDIFVKGLTSDQKATFSEQLEKEFSWKLDGNTPIPDKIICSARLQFTETFDKTYPTLTATPSVTIANNGLEALSSKLAMELKKETDFSDTTLRTLEDQIEAVGLSASLADKLLDVRARFDELRHEKGFKPSNKMFFWRIVKKEITLPQGKEAATPVPLSKEVMEKLNDLNKWQRTYDEGWLKAVSKREQLYADWYKYMIASYPPNQEVEGVYPYADMVKYFIEKKGLQELNYELAWLGILPDFDQTPLDTLTVENNHTIAAKIISVIKAIVKLLAAHPNQFELKRVLGARFWEPTDPVVLLEGEGIEKCERHGEDGILKVFTASFNKSIVEVVKENFVTLANEGIKIAPHVQEKQAWNPLMLDWEIQFFPTQTKSNQHVGTGTYATDFITENYEMTYKGYNLSFKNDKGRVINLPSTYTGSSFLTSFTTTHLQENIIHHFEEHGLIEAYKKATGVTSIDFTKLADILAFKTWYKNKSTFKEDGILTQICALKEIQGMTCLSQSLGGFNEALLMKQQSVIFPIDDPLGFGEKDNRNTYKGFSATTMAQAVADQRFITPSPLNHFHPIQAGVLKINRLQLVDTFGQVKQLSYHRINTSCDLKTDASNYLVKVHPKLSQPARINFRWLNKSSEDIYLGNQENESPIQGWFMTNKLDKSLQVYDEKGNALGYFKAGRWHYAIDSDQAIAVENIKNEHLKKVVLFIQKHLQKNTAFLEAFIGVIDDALEDHILPEVAHQQEGISLLIGKPIALVRASFDLQLLGDKAINQSWNVFRQDMAKSKRTTDGFEEVKFPVRLGEYGKLNDGLIGYWLEQDEDGIISYQNNTFYSPQSDHIDMEGIESHYQKNGKPEPAINFFHAISDAPQIISMLMYPQGTLHANIGILPTKEIRIPPAHYTEALKEIDISFLTAPVLTPHNKMTLPLVIEDDFEWSWVECEKWSTDVNQVAWKEIKALAKITKTAFVKVWEETGNVESISAQEVWVALCSKDIGWLVPESTNLETAYVLPQYKRKTPVFSGKLVTLEVAVEKTLGSLANAITPAKSHFSSFVPNILKEGWLKIRKIIKK